MPLANNTKQKKLNFQTALAIVLILIAISSMGYKYYEWSTVKNLQRVYTVTQKEEIARELDTQKLDKELSLLVKDMTASKSADIKTISDTLSQINGKINIYTGFIKAENETLDTNKSHFEKTKYANRYIFGQRGEFLREITDNSLRLYDLRKEINTDNLIQSYALENIFTIWQDNARVNTFRVKTAKNPKVDIPKYIGEVSDLAKYAKSDYKLIEEEKIKEFYPKTYEYIMNYKRFLGGFYELMYAYSQNDLETVAYRAGSIDDLSKSLNADLSVIFDENKGKKQERIEELIKTSQKITLAINGLQNNRLHEYPIVGKITNWNQSISICRVYDIKIALYKLLTKEYPKATNTDELIKDLATVTPKTDKLDKIIDKKQITYTATKDLGTLVCKDDSNDEYIFETLKD